MTTYHGADIAPLSETTYGIGFHWTTWNVPPTGEPLPFEDAVDAFDVDAFVAQAVECGAGHVMLTTTHAVHHLPCPSAEVDRILPGRTCRRDLIMELADVLASADIRLMLYYNHGTWTPTPGQEQDRPWQEAVGSLADDRTRYYDNYCRVLGELGHRYGSKVIAWWFDSGYEHIKYADTPWEQFTAAAKAGHDRRLVTYNSGVFGFESYTDYQDYWAGEINGLGFWPLGGDRSPSGLPWYSFVTWHGSDAHCRVGEWGINADNRDRDWPATDPQVAVSYLRAFNGVGGAVTFNLLCWQNGTAYHKDLATMKAVKAAIRDRS